MRHSIHAIFFDQADAHEAAERWDQALAMLYQVHRWAPDDPDLWRRMGVLSYRMADRAWLSQAGLEATHVGDMGAINADRYFARAAELTPHDPRGPFWHGWTRLKLFNDPAAARASLNEAIARDGHWPYAHAALGRVALEEAEAGSAAEVVAYLRRAVTRLPESARLQYDLGLALLGVDDRAGAEAAFAAAIACPTLPAPAGTEGRTLAAEFHGEAHELRPLIERLLAT